MTLTYLVRKYIASNRKGTSIIHDICFMGIFVKISNRPLDQPNLVLIHKYGKKNIILHECNLAFSFKFQYENKVRLQHGSKETI